MLPVPRASIRRETSLRDVERALEVEVDDGVDVVVEREPEDAVTGHAGVVDEYVDACPTRRSPP